MSASSDEGRPRGAAPLTPRDGHSAAPPTPRDGHSAPQPGSSSYGDGSRLVTAIYRSLRVWRALPPERRLAAGAAFGLFVALFLPWYQETVIARGLTGLRSVSASLTGWQAFSFVEAAVLLVAAGVLILLFVRAEGRAFHVPGGDGAVITAAGLWACLLIMWRMFDKEGLTGHGQYATSSGIEWGIFIALGVAALLAYAGTRIRVAHEPEPALPGDPGGLTARVAPVTGPIGRQSAGAVSASAASAVAVSPGPGSAGSASPGAAPAGSASPDIASSGPERQPREWREQATTETELIQRISGESSPTPEDTVRQTRRRRPRSIAGDRRTQPPPVQPDDDDPTVISARRQRGPSTTDPEDQLTMPLERPD